MATPSANPSKRKKNALSIRLAESAVFLRTHEPTAARRRSDASQDAAGPALVRGLLVLQVVNKPLKVSSIDVTLQARTSASWQEGIGARRIEVSETHTIFEEKAVFFQASPALRRHSSIGPGIRSRFDADSGICTSPVQSTPPSYNARETRRMSADFPTLQNNSLYRNAYTLQSPPPTPPAFPEYQRSRDSGEDVSSLSRQHSYRPSQGHSTPGSPPSSFFDHQATPSSASSIPSLRDRTLSRRPSFEDVPEEAVSSAPGSRTPQEPRSSTQTGSPRSASRDRRGRTRSTRFSLGSVSNALLDAVRSGSPSTRGRQIDRSQDSSREPSESRGRVAYKPVSNSTALPSVSFKTSKESFALAKIFKLDKGERASHDQEAGDGKWFKPGTYTYAISFTIPGDASPSLECSWGSVIWKLKANVHRPGTFTGKLSTSRVVNVIHSPMEEDHEDTDSIMVERHWDQQLQYLVAISGRSFFIGGTIPISLTLMPLAKIKVHKLTVYIEERIDYLTQMKRIARTDPKSHILLLSVKKGEKDEGPVLPLESNETDAFRKSPLYQLLSPDDDPSEMASSLMGPGPWTFHKELQVPMSCTILHFTNKNKKSNVIISHALKFIIRLERGDEKEMDAKTGKKKLFDIVIQTPIQILSCRCNPEWAGLPPYSECLDTQRSFEDKCPCQLRREAQAEGTSLQHILSRASSESQASAVESVPVDSRMPSLRATESLYRSNEQYERLISGQEGVMGEVPPPYDVSSFPGTPQSE